MNAEIPGYPDHPPNDPKKADGKLYVPSTKLQRDIQHTENEQTKQNRHAAIEGFLIEHDCLQNMDWNHPDIPDGLVTELVKLEVGFRKANPDFDLTQKSPAFVTKNAELIWKRLQTKADEVKVSETQQKNEVDAEAAEFEVNSYAHKIASLKSEGKSNVELVEELANDPAVPESEKAKYQAFQKIIALAQTPEDRRIITNRVNTLDPARMPDPIAFIQTQVFDQGETKSGVSETTQKHIAKAFGIPRVRNATVADMESNLDRKVPTYNEDGEIIGYDPAITKDNPIEVRPGITMYVENGHKVYQDQYSGEVFPFEGGASGRAIDKMKMQYLSSRPDLLNSGVEDLMGWNLKNARMPKEHELHKIHKVQNLLLGGSRNLSAEVMWAGEHQQFAHSILFVSQFGETSPHTHSSDQMLASRKQLGISRSGDILDIDEDIMAETGDWLNGNPHASGRRAYDELQKHLHTLFPDKVNAPNSSTPENTEKNLDM